MPNYFDESGNVTDEFRTELPTMLGDDHADNKMYGDIIDREDKTGASDIALMIKSGADTKAMVGKKMDNVIQRPGENATDEEKAEFTKALLSGLGTAEKVEDFDFAKPTDIPEGMDYSEDQVNAYRQWCLDNKIPKDIAKLYLDYHDGMQRDIFAKGQETAQTVANERNEAWEADCEKLKADWPGVELGKNLRIALNAIKTFNKNNPELLAALDKSGLYTNPENFGALRESGLTPSNIRGWQEIGEALLDGSFERGNAVKEGDSDNTKQMKGMYNHPTSAKLFKS